MLDEFRDVLPPGTPVDVLDISLHCRPRRLHASLRRAIEAADGVNDPILLGYGLCSQAVVGLVAENSSLVVLRTDDCIGAFLGSRRAQRSLALAEPGSCFVSRGWIGDGAGSLLDEFHRLVSRVGERRARAMMGHALRNYRWLVHIVMPGARTLEADRRYARGMADTLGLRYREMPGTAGLITAMALAGRTRTSSPARRAPRSPWRRCWPEPGPVPSATTATEGTAMSPASIKTTTDPPENV